MSLYTPSVNDNLINRYVETPVCTPVPQASSTTAHRNCDSMSSIKHSLPDETVPDLHLEGAIGGLESISDKFKNLRLHLSEQKDILTTDNKNWNSNEKDTESEAESSLGILKLDDLQALLDTKWVFIKPPEHIPIICVGVPYEIMLPIQNVTDHWILCGLLLEKVEVVGFETTEDDNAAVIQLPSKRVLMDPTSTKEAKIKIVPLFEGRIEISLKILLRDVVTKEEQFSTFILYIMGEEPKLEIKKPDNTSSYLNFGTLPEECAKALTLSFCNTGKAKIPLKVSTVEQGKEKCPAFVLIDPEKQSQTNNIEDEIVKELNLTLKSGEKTNIKVMFAAPPINLLAGKRGFVQLSGKLSVELCGLLPIELESFDLTGCVGVTKLGVFRTSVPMKLTVSKLGESVSQSLPLKNNGLVPLVLSLFFLKKRKIEEESLTVEPSDVELKPGEEMIPIITFKPTKVFTSPIVSILQITMHPLGPKFYMEVSATIENRTSKETILKNNIKHIRSVGDSKFKSKNEFSAVPVKPSPQYFPSGSSSMKSKGNIDSKFNVKSGCSSRRSTRSQRSSSSRSSLSDKLNVRTTHRELIWGSVAVGKCVTKAFNVRNEDHCNMSADVSIDGNFKVFELTDQEGNSVPTRNLTLNPMKNYSFSVTFKPHQVGAFHARLVFVVHDLRLVIPLYGYGGHARLIAKGVPRDGAGRMWLMLYQHPHKMEWETSFHLRNLGDIKAFVKIKPISKGFQNVICQSLTVEPMQLVITEGGSTKISIKYQPQHKDLKFLMSNTIQDVVEVAALSLVTGDEATRQRLRSIHNKSLKSGEEKVPVLSSNLELEPLCQYFPGEEEEGTSKIMLLNDPQDSATDLYSAGVSHQEVILLLENATDGHGVDASRAFQSMYQYVVDLSTTRFDVTDVVAKSGLVWEVTPRSITLQPPQISSAAVVLSTKSLFRLSFETSVTDNPPGFTLIIYTENEMKELQICIQCGQHQKKEPQGFKSASSVVSNFGHHHKSTGSDSKLFPNKVPASRKTLNVGTSRAISEGDWNTLPSIKNFKNMLVLDADDSYSLPHEPEELERHSETSQVSSLAAIHEEKSNLQRLTSAKVLSPFKQPASVVNRYHRSGNFSIKKISKEKLPFAQK